MRLVLDTGVVAAGFCMRDGACRRLLVGALERRFLLVLPVLLLVEYEAALRRAGCLMMAEAREADVTALLDGFAGVCVPVGLDPGWRVDGGAEALVVEAAVAGHADAVVSLDVAAFEPSGIRLGFAVRRPAELARRLR